MLESVIKREAEQPGERYNLHAIQVPEQTEFPISEKELIKKLNVSRSLILKLRNELKIPFLRLGSRVLYQPSKVISALEVIPTNQSA